jgi:hypothetical protein
MNGALLINRSAQNYDDIPDAKPIPLWSPVLAHFTVNVQPTIRNGRGNLGAKFKT